MVSISLPESQSIAKVTIIDNGARISGRLSFFMEPVPEYIIDEVLKAPAYVFFVENESSGRRVVFDLGIRKDPENLSPPVLAYHKDFSIQGGEDISEFLQHRDIDLKSIEAVIWSHHHLDHTGNPAGFPAATDLVVGPSFKETILPGYPKDPKGQILETDYEGRNIRQLDFGTESNGLVIGGFRAIDYFGDGSFYLLEVPGHTVDHIAGLARTSVSPSRFILEKMGADTGHHVSQWRPTRYLPLPKELTPSPLGVDHRFNLRTNVCPGHVFIDHVHPDHSDNTPFTQIKAGHSYDVESSRKSLEQMQLFDADENIIVIMAHDYTMLPVMEFWPQTANDWHKANWKESGRWLFLNYFNQVLEKALARTTSQ
ncbi:Metallo-hydrolase/oxidoreductase [Xylaria telfairii]|nr:Metallo-hydrolase/oxidoreductase [Xylaria telfairii]